MGGKHDWKSWFPADWLGGGASEGVGEGAFPPPPGASPLPPSLAFFQWCAIHVVEGRAPIRASPFLPSWILVGRLPSFSLPLPSSLRGHDSSCLVVPPTGVEPLVSLFEVPGDECSS